MGIDPNTRYFFNSMFFKPSKPASSNATELLLYGSAASKENPTAIVVGEFIRPMGFDLNGDGHIDDVVTHDGLIQRTLQHKGVRVIPIQKGDKGPGILHQVAEKLENGELKADVVSLSWGVAQNSPTFSALGEQLDMDLTRQNIGQHRKKLVPKIIHETNGKSIGPPVSPYAFLMREETGLDDYLARRVVIMDSGIQRIQKAGPEVVAAGGNATQDRFEVGSVNADHILAATNAKGKEIENYSANHALTQPAQGTYGIRKITASNGKVLGYSVDGDKIPEYFPEELSGGSSIIDQYKGKAVKDLVVAKIPETLYEKAKSMVSEEDIMKSARVELLNKHFPGKLFNYEDFVKYHLANRGLSQEALGKLIAKMLEDADGKKYAYIAPRVKFFFSADKNGKIIYDPDGSGSPDQVAKLTGTSFSPIDFIPKKYGKPSTRPKSGESNIAKLFNGMFRPKERGKDPPNTRV